MVQKRLVDDVNTAIGRNEKREAKTYFDGPQTFGTFLDHFKNLQKALDVWDIAVEEIPDI